MSTPAPTPVGRSIIKYKMHWHVVFTHFPVSFFVAAFGFQILHLFFSPACLELATNIVLIAGVVMMIPTTWSGWNTWKKNFKGANTFIFRRKIVISFIMLGVGILLVFWRVIFLGLFDEHPESPSHWIYLFGNTLMIIGTIAEGYYGGRLNHR